jgi:hypothetical protein
MSALHSCALARCCVLRLGLWPLLPILRLGLALLRLLDEDAPLFGFARDQNVPSERESFREEPHKYANTTNTTPTQIYRHEQVLSAPDKND